MPANILARPIIPILIIYMAGIILGERFPGYGDWAIGTIAFAFAAVGWRLWQRRVTFAGPVILFLALGYLSIQPWAAPDFPSHHVIHHADSQKWTVIGIIAEAPIVRPKRQKLIVEATGLETVLKTGSRQYEACGRIRITVGEGEDLDLNRGDRIRVSGRLKRVYGFHNPGGFNYERYLAFQKIWCRMWVSPQRVVILDHSVSPTLSGRVEKIRQTVARLVDQSVSGESREVLKALVIGDRSGISPSLREMFNRTGIGHLLAISGLHIGIVASVAFFLFKWLLSYSRFLLHRAWAGKFAAIFTFIPVIIYGVMAGMSPSTQRALVMVAVFLLAYLAGKIQDAFNTLAVAGVVILAVYPPAVFSISFQLSFAAVALIILGISRPWPESRSGVVPRFPIIKKIGSLMAGTVLAILGTLPLVMQSFNEVSLIGIGTNLLAVPLIGFVVVPTGLLGMFIHPVSTFLATTCFNVAGYILEMTLVGTHFLADLPFASLKTITPSMIEVILYYVLVSMGVMLAPAFLAYLKGLNWRTQPGLIGVSDIKIIVTIALVAGVAAVADVGYWTYQRYWHRDLKVTVIDVGTGSAAVVEFPRGPVMLIDGGGFSDNSVFDVGARVVAPVLWRKKIMTVDTIVLSHPNSDHLNGLIYIAEHFHV
ncbi:MAG: DNA internalization-related competence protein ComEC/Rec2, partial [Thermodesulfobacteriota bacterium]|nr:DNA internalization-related competence protein ComEC/Rec2 [Thermodesulfobacteriota bacterium]